MSGNASFEERVRRVRWYHEFDFGGGLATRPEHPYRELWERTEKVLAKVDFAGKRVLDVGCWDGYWSFYAERRGAARVLATDLLSQRWSSVAPGPDFTPAVGPDGAEGFRLAHERFGSRVEYRGDVGAYDLPSLGERFDVVLFLGVLYHLTHPMYALTQLRHAVEKGGVAVVESAAIDDVKKSAMDFYFGFERDDPEEYRGDWTNHCVPTRRCLKDMLSANYFDVEEADFLPPAPPPDEASRNVLVRAARKVRRASTGGGYGRQLLVARAVEREDPRHACEPLLGLARYDSRFR